MHVPAGYTKVLLERTGISLDVPTESIPSDLRSIGSRFVLVLTRSAEKTFESMTVDEIRNIYQTSVERITDE
jgi:hypothetical protein